MRFSGWAVVGLASFLLAGNGPPGFQKHFTLIGDFPLGASVSRADYESFDRSTRRLYIAGMGAGQLVVFDTVRDRVIEVLNGFPKITGVLAIPELHKVYTSVPGGGLVGSFLVGLGMIGLSSGRGTIAVVDDRTLKERARMPGGVFPDGITYDPKDGRVFVSDELGSAITVIDVRADRPVGRIDTGGEVGNVRYDSALGKVFAPLQSRNQLVAVDPEFATIVARYALPGGNHPHGFVIAPTEVFGYVASDGNDRLLTVDLKRGRVLNSAALAHDPDVLAIDASAHRLYVATESGTLSILDIADERAPAVVDNVFIAKGAHSLAVDPDTHRLYFDVADLGGRSMVRVLVPRH